MSDNPYYTIAHLQEGKTTKIICTSDKYKHKKGNEKVSEICDLRHISKAYIREGIESASIVRECGDITEEYLELVFPSSLRKLHVNTVDNMIKLDISACNKLQELFLVAEYYIGRTNIPIIDEFPKTLKKLTVGFFDHWPDYPLPKSLEYLKLCKGFNKKLPELPRTLKTLVLGKDFDQDIDNLPKSLETLKLGRYFSKNLNLPAKLKVLDMYINESFNKELVLPNTLKCLKLGISYNRKLNLPDSLNTLVLGEEYDQEIELPKNLKHLRVESNYSKKLNFPNSIKKLSLGHLYKQEIDVPDSIEILKIYNPKTKINKWPKNLKILKITKEMKDIKGVPENVKIVYM
jgi:hypothetical protein